MTHTLPLARVHLDDVLTAPPVGHRGLWTSTDQPAYAVGETLVFVVYGDVEVGRGVVTAIERPGDPVRDGEEPWRGWWRTRWVDDGQRESEA